MAEEKEIWKDIPGYEGWYQVSNFGGIRSMDRYVNYRDNRKPVFYKGRVIKPQRCSNGYLFVYLYGQRSSRSHLIHRLVGLCFVNNNKNKPHINHIDGDKENNHHSNLEWVTRSENQKHRYTHLGQVSEKRKLNKKQVFLIYQSNLTYTELANIFNVTYGTIKFVKNGDTYKQWYNEYHNK